MKVSIYQIDAFSDCLFGGNPAAICPLESWLQDEVMQQIAEENNLSETAFFVKEGQNYHIRWFTPTIEVDLCGHATLAAAFVIRNYLMDTSLELSFNSRSGILPVTVLGDLYVLNFPADVIKPVSVVNTLVEALGSWPLETYKGRTDYMLVFSSEKEILGFKPDFNQLAQVEARGIMVTAPGDHVDFVSRFFGPRSGINEDPVTGSAHTTLTPYWAKRLGKNNLIAKQISKRSGELYLKNLGERVEIGGKAKAYLIGEIETG
jgi:PhzF family phenazine biosynthesis protein